jgi:16S rRNA processing protein RimM
LKLFALGKNEARRKLEVEEAWPHKAGVVLKFTGINSISEAEALTGCELQVPRQERATLDAGSSYVSDLSGCRVFDRRREIGVLTDVRFGAGEAPLLIVTSEKSEYEIPFAEAYIRSLDIGRKRIEMELPEGLLDVNTPLTPEEKREQQARRKRAQDEDRNNHDLS